MLNNGLVVPKDPIVPGVVVVVCPVVPSIRNGIWALVKGAGPKPVMNGLRLLENAADETSNFPWNLTADPSPARFSNRVLDAADSAAEVLRASLAATVGLSWIARILIKLSSAGLKSGVGMTMGCCIGKRGPRKKVVIAGITRLSRVSRGPTGLN